jgi:hypothetical protein
VTALAALVLPAASAAHTRSQSFSTWTLSGSDVRVVFSVAARELTRLAALAGPEADLDALLAAHAQQEIRAWSGDAACELAGSPTPLASRPGLARLELRLRCPEGPALRIRIATFFEVAPAHVHFARVRGAGGRAVEYLFSEAHTEIELARNGGAVQPGPGATLGGYVWLGIEHIAGGLDHLAFLLALLLLCRGLREVVWIATGFTLGHSITLMLAVLGRVKPEVKLVEALIGFTIALVAAENVAVRRGTSGPTGRAIAGGLIPLAALAAWRADAAPALALAGLALFTACYTQLCDTPERARRLRPAVTLVFGLVHGFGFAGQLLAVGVPAERLLPALVGFNLGVELGQIALVSLAWGASALLLGRWPALARRSAPDLVSAALFGLGLYWFVGRTYG